MLPSQRRWRFLAVLVLFLLVVTVRVGAQSSTDRRIHRTAVVRSRVRRLPWVRRAGTARRDSGLRYRSAGLHRLQPDHARSRSRLVVGCPSGRARPRVRSDDAGLRRRAHEAEIALVIEHVRTFCAERGWPRGDLNFPRPFVTEKAFPENEAVLTATIVPSTSVGQHQFLYEHRVGRRGQYEIFVPFDLQESAAIAWQLACGDIGAAYKHVLFDSLRTDRSCRRRGVQLQERVEGLGKGVAMFEAFGTVSQVLPRDGFLHAHAGIEVPTDAEQAPRRCSGGSRSARASWRTLGARMVPDGRILAGASSRTGSATEWDVLPQMQVSLSTRQHVLMNVGVRVPLTQRTERRVERARLSAVGLVRRRFLFRMVMRALLGRHRRCRPSSPVARDVRAAQPHEIFETSDHAWRAITACGRRWEDVSIGASWRASMMANSSRDPYWQAGVRTRSARSSRGAQRDSGRVRDVPHADVSHRSAHHGDEGSVFAHLACHCGKRIDPIGSRMTAWRARSAIRSPTRISARRPASPAAMSSDADRSACLERADADLRPVQDRARNHHDHALGDGIPADRSAHVRQSELCATCHTLVTKARGPNGEVIGELPEQMPFLEWKHSAFAGEQRSCQSCHMPVVEETRRSRRYSARRAKGSRATRSSAAMSSCSGCSAAIATSWVSSPRPPRWRPLQADDRNLQKSTAGCRSIAPTARAAG